MNTAKDFSAVRKRFLIIQTAFIGDAVLALPVAQELRKRNPDAEIHFLVRDGNQVILKNHPAVDVVWTWNKKEKKYASLFGLWKKLRKIHFDSIFNCQRYASTGLLTALLHGKEKAGFSSNPFRFFYSRAVPHVISGSAENAVHEVDRNLSLLNVKDSSERRPRLYPGEAETKKIAVFKPAGKYIVIAPASVWFTKQLPAETWKAFVKSVPAEIHIFIVGAKSESGLGGEISKCHANAKNLCGQLNLLDSAALMQNAMRVFVNDSGALHLASGVNAPVTAAFCSTVPRFGFGPLSDDSVIVETKELLSCRPCGIVGKSNCPEGHFRCGTGIASSALLDSLNLATR